MKITFLPDNIVCDADAGMSIMEAAAKAGLVIAADCRGNGTCGRCRVRAVSGDFLEVSAEESTLLDGRALSEGWRLACRAYPISDCIIELPAAGDSAEKGNLRLPGDFAPDADEGVKPYGIAFDIGTTTVAGMLCNMKTGGIIACASRSNPQGAWGADVISRIEFCINDRAGLRLLNRALSDCMGDIEAELIAASSVKPRDAGAALAVGNTTMTHILFNTDPSSLARAPFSPAFLAHEPVSAAKAGLKLARGAKLSALPNIAGHVGADITAAILSSRIYESCEPAMLIDVGTNGEMAFTANGRLLVCSTAAGPAFEGACIKHGMRAAPGAVTRCDMIDGRFIVTTVASERPKGLCGSGLIDITALLIQYGIIDATGKILSPDKAQAAGAPDALISRLRQEGRVYSFALYEDDDTAVTLTQKDVREVQLAKAAIAAGMKLLMRELGITPGDLSRVMLAGAFGSHIRASSALGIGLLPPVGEERVVQLGNAAGAGACMALMSKKEADMAFDIVKRAEHIELASHPDFQKEFIEAMRF